jgi:hypothetical protein
MDNRATDLLKGITLIYQQQMSVYKQLYEITLYEKQVIDAGDPLDLLELLQLEDGLISQIKIMEKDLRFLREHFMQVLPGRKMGLDQLACILEPDVYIHFKQALFDVKSLLKKIEIQKCRNVVVLGERLQQPDLQGSISH